MKGVKTLRLANETVSGSQGAMFAEYNGRRFVLASVSKFKAKFKANTSKKGVLGLSAKQSRPAGWEGSWEATLYYNQSTFRAIAEIYKDTGVMPTLSIQVINEDLSSIKTIGRQSVTFLDCFMEETILAAIDVDAEVLEEDVSGTFNDFEFAEKFKDFPTA